jgi:hypothetical protein
MEYVEGIPTLQMLQLFVVTLGGDYARPPKFKQTPFVEPIVAWTMNLSGRRMCAA